MSGTLASRTAIVIAALVSFCGPARASFHLMQIEQVMGGVNGDTTAQAIQLRMRAPGQNFLNTDAGGTNGPADLFVRDAQGLNPVLLIEFPHDVTNGVTGGHVLIASAKFANHVSPALVPDFTLTNLIPAADLTAGRLTYEAQGHVLWSLAYGGAAYTGPTGGVPLFNSTTGDSGKSLGGLPTSGLSALQFQGGATAKNANNATDYALTPTPAIFINNAGASFTAVPEPTSLALFGTGGVLLILTKRRLRHARVSEA